MRKRFEFSEGRLSLLASETRTVKATDVMNVRAAVELYTVTQSFVKYEHIEVEQVGPPGMKLIIE